MISESDKVPYNRYKIEAQHALVAYKYLIFYMKFQAHKNSDKA